MLFRHIIDNSRRIIEDSRIIPQWVMPQFGVSLMVINYTPYNFHKTGHWFPTLCTMGSLCEWKRIMFEQSSRWQHLSQFKSGPFCTRTLDYFSKIERGNTNWGRRLHIVYLHIIVACFVNRVNYIFNINRSWSKLVSTRRSTVLSLLLQLVFPAATYLQWPVL
jgi:hypothetical protein